MLFKSSPVLRGASETALKNSWSCTIPSSAWPANARMPVKLAATATTSIIAISGYEPLKLGKIYQDLSKLGSVGNRGIAEEDI